MKKARNSENLLAEFNGNVVKQFENLTKVIETQGKIIVDLQKKVDFLCQHNKDDVALTYNTISYIYAQELHTVKTPTVGRCSIENNTSFYAIIKSEFRQSFDYYKLDKANGTIIDITEEYEQIIQNNKSRKKKQCP